MPIFLLITPAKPLRDIFSPITKIYRANNWYDDYAISNKDIRNMVVFGPLVFRSSMLATTLNANFNCTKVILAVTTVGGKQQVSGQTMPVLRVC